MNFISKNERDQVATYPDEVRSAFNRAVCTYFKRDALLSRVSKKRTRESLVDSWIRRHGVREFWRRPEVLIHTVLRIRPRFSTPLDGRVFEVNTSKSGWYSELLRDIRCTRIETLTGESIEKMSRAELGQHQEFFWVCAVPGEEDERAVVRDMPAAEPSTKYSKATNLVLEKWLAAVRAKIIEVVGRTLGGYDRLQMNRFKARRSEYIRAFIAKAMREATTTVVNIFGQEEELTRDQAVAAVHRFVTEHDESGEAAKQIQLSGGIAHYVLDRICDVYGNEIEAWSIVLPREYGAFLINLHAKNGDRAPKCDSNLRTTLFSDSLKKHLDRVNPDVSADVNIAFLGRRDRYEIPSTVAFYETLKKIREKMEPSDANMDEVQPLDDNFLLFVDLNIEDDKSPTASANDEFEGKLFIFSDPTFGDSKKRPTLQNLLMKADMPELLLDRDTKVPEGCVEVVIVPPKELLNKQSIPGIKDLTVLVDKNSRKTKREIVAKTVSGRGEFVLCLDRNVCKCNTMGGATWPVSEYKHPSDKKTVFIVPAQ